MRLLSSASQQDLLTTCRISRPSWSQTGRDSISNL